MKREEIQEKTLKLSQSGIKHILLEWPTGLGKSKAAIDIIKDYGGEWLLVCKETNHIQNWKDEFEKHGCLDIWEERVTAICYASLHKYVDTDFNLVLDEVHAAGSELRVESLKTITPGKIVSLSATVDPEIKKKLKEIAEFEEYKITTSEAIEWKILPEPTINIVKIELEDSEKKNKWRPHSGAHYKYYTDKEYYERLSKNIDYWGDRYNRNHEEWEKIKMLREGLKRKMFIARMKSGKTEEIIKDLRSKGKRFICFCGSIEQCEEVGTNLVHSKINKNIRQQTIDKFNRLEINELFAVDMLQESMNLNQIDAGIIVQLDNGERTAIQMIGRILRSIAPEVYIIVVRGTQDEQYMNKALQSIETKYINYI